jgi:ApbE superfamily uncharacterized protein (UPF0280 family)
MYSRRLVEKGIEIRVMKSANTHSLVESRLFAARGKSRRKMVWKKGKGAYQERTYRKTRPQTGWHDFTVRYKQTDLWIQADQDIRSHSERVLLEARLQVESYMGRHQDFITTHGPLPLDHAAPPVAKNMLESAQAVGVGPMAAVAGSIAQYVGERLLEHCTEVVVENGGDLYLNAKRPLIIGVFAGASPLSSRLGLMVTPEEMPVGISTSSASVGHSWSYGNADAACVVADHGALADAAATALCNRAGKASDIEQALAWILEVSGVRGGLVIQGRTVAAQGRVQLTTLEREKRGA